MQKHRRQLGPGCRIDEVRAWRDSASERDEIGATLILALVFMTATSLIVFGLLSWSQNNLTSVSTFQQNRALNYAANSAMETAIGTVRYNPNPTECPSSGSGLSIDVPNPNSAYDMTIDVWCQQQQPGEQPSAASRVVNFAACWANSYSAGTCSSGFTPGSPPLLTATVTYDDYSDSIVGGQEIAYPAGALCSISTSCGATMTVNSWAFKQKS